MADKKDGGCYGSFEKISMAQISKDMKKRDLPAPANVLFEPENVEMFRSITNGMVDLYKRKNNDYGDSFHQSFLEEGMAAARFRIGDKFNRFKKVSRGEKTMVDDETLRDTLIDMANYCIMTIIEMDRMEGK